jgi:branched-chain amino acid transport system substrate-binding protein
MRQQEVNATFMAGDGIATDEFASIGGPAVVGTLMTFGPNLRNYPEAKAVIEKFRSNRFVPDANALYSYAAVQII